MTEPRTAASEDWRGKWDDIGTRQDRLTYLREYWPLLIADIEATAAVPLDVDLPALHLDALTLHALERDLMWGTTTLSEVHERIRAITEQPHQHALREYARLSEEGGT